jgi:carbon monoxide dehydrogenase subunit G
MISVSDSITVDASREAVYEFLDDPQNHAQITPSLEDVRDVEPLDNGGKRLAFTYSLGGVGLDGELEEVEHVPPETLRFEMSGRLAGELTFTLEETDGGTRVTYAADYEVPGRVIERLAEPFVWRYNERELRTTLENLKTRLETDGSERP